MHSLPSPHEPCASGVVCAVVLFVAVGPKSTNNTAEPLSATQVPHKCGTARLCGVVCALVRTRVCGRVS